MKLGTIIAIVIALAGCSFIGLQTYSSKAEKENELIKLEKAKEQMKEQERMAQQRRPYPAPPPPPGAPPPVSMKKPSPVEIGEPIGGGSPIVNIPSTKPIVTKQNNIKETQDTVTKQLFNAALAFVIPETANINESIKAQLLINLNKEAQELEKELTKKGTITSKQIKVSKVVKATIVAPDFDVYKITEEEQILSDDQSTEWLWTLEPKSSGSHDVNLSVTAIINVDGKETKHHLKTFEKTVTINITTTQIIFVWLSKYWQWIISTLIIPLLIWLYKKKFSSKDSQ